MKNEKVKVEVVRETAKAFFVRNAEGAEVWIQRRWMDANGMVNASHFLRAAAERAAKEARDNARRKFAESYHELGAPARESEKALMFVATFVDTLSGEQVVRRNIWVPRSLAQGTAVVGWFLNKKVAEEAGSFRIPATCEQVGSFYF